MAITITSFNAGSGTINLAQSTTLTPVFSGGTAVILPGNIPVNSGTAVTVTPALTTVYSLFVTSSTGETAVRQTTITVTIPAEKKLALDSGSTGGVIVGSDYWVNGKPVYHIWVGVNPMSTSDHLAQTNENSIYYDVTVNNDISFQIVGTTDLNTFLAEFDLIWQSPA